MTSRADLYAIAIIAASKAMNVDPIAALTVKGHEARKALYPAAWACWTYIGPSERSLARSFRFARSGFSKYALRKDSPSEEDARLAADYALRKALFGDAS